MRTDEHSDMDIREAFGIVLRRVRERTGVSQEKLATACGLDRTTLSLLERGKQMPTLGTILILAAQLGVDGSTLVALVEAELDDKKLKEITKDDL